MPVGLPWRLRDLAPAEIRQTVARLICSVDGSTEVDVDSSVLRFGNGSKFDPWFGVSSWRLLRQPGSPGSESRSRSALLNADSRTWVAVCVWGDVNA